jgi:Fe-S-cluster-containing dehydrogenase component/formate-dependent nitrite reductase membrane component NrfD
VPAGERYSPERMPTYGFAIDLRKCIGCHACTIACKAEHQIPIGVNRCWVKSVERGVFPSTRRLFFPVLCNQCADAPCVTICPTRALFRRGDGIVDLQGDVCIGCRACMVACPYDQLFIDPNTHTAEKCNFCANRIENQLLPACVSVCPTECRIFGDLDDPTSEVARIATMPEAAVRRPEKATRPKVFYIGANETVLEPELPVRPFLYKEGQVILRPLAAPAPDILRPGEARVDYDMPHVKPWGFDMAVYLLTKGIATGTMLVSVLLLVLQGHGSPLSTLVGPSLSLLFLVVTAVVLIADLERPERFYYILIRPNWRSWMAWGAYLLAVQGAITAAWLAAGVLRSASSLSLLVWPAAASSIMTTIYTGFLFAQGVARDLWQGPRSTIDLLAQAVVEGAASLLLAAVLTATAGDPNVVGILSGTLAIGMLVHLALIASEYLLTSGRTRHRRLAIAALRRGPFAPLFWGGALGASSLSIALGAIPGQPLSMAAAAVLALSGSFAWEYLWIEAGQSAPIS